MFTETLDLKSFFLKSTNPIWEDLKNVNHDVLANYILNMNKATKIL